MSAIQTNPSSVNGVGAIQGLASGQDSPKSASNQVMARAIQELIEKFDTNKDSKLDASELKDMFSQLMKPGGDEKSSCCDAKGGGSSGGAGGKDNSMDINKDGKVDMQDLLAMLMGMGAQGGEGAKGGQGAQGGGGGSSAAGAPEAGGGAASGAPTGAQAAPGASEAGMDEKGQFDIEALVNLLVQMLGQMLQGGSGGQAAPGAEAGGGGGGKQSGGADINKDGKVDIQDLLAMLMGQGAQSAGGGGAAPGSSSGGGGGAAGGVGGAGGADSAGAAGGAGQGADAGGGLDGQIDLEALLGALMQMLQQGGQGGGAAQSGQAAGGSPQAGGEQAGGGDVNKDGKIDMQDLMALLSQLMGQGSDPAASGGGGSGSGGGSPAPSGSGGGGSAPAAQGAGGGAPAAQGGGGGAPAVSGSGGGAAATQGGGGGGAGAAGAAMQGADNASNGSKPAPSAGSGGGEVGPSATDGKPKVDKFETIEPGEGPGQTIGKDGKFVFNRVVDDSFLPKEVRAGMKDAVDKNMKDNDFFKDNFRNEKDAYQYLVQMANLESARGTTLKNSGDAQNTGTGSSGYMHLHDKFGYEKEQGGRKLNTEGWTPEEAQQDYSKYTTLVMRKLDAGYQQAGANNTQEAAEKTMSMWWVGNDSTDAGKYYLSALSNGSGVNHNTGSTFA